MPERKLVGKMIDTELLGEYKGQVVAVAGPLSSEGDPDRYKEIQAEILKRMSAWVDSTRERVPAREGEMSVSDMEKHSLVGELLAVASSETTMSLQGGRIGSISRRKRDLCEEIEGRMTH